MSSSAVASRIHLLADQTPGELLVHEIYRSLQGESTYAGLPCAFIRLAVCDARCVWCDTPHAFNQGQKYPLDSVVDLALGLDTPLVEVTGGEPLLQPAVFPLMTRLADTGRTVLLETSGAHDISPVDPRVVVIMDIKCPDSGECDNNRWANLEHLKTKDQVKFVVASRADWDWAASVIRKRRLEDTCEVLVSGVFDSVPLAELASWVLDSRLNVRMQLQLHKFIWDPVARGV